MRRDEFAQFDTNKKRGTKAVVVIAVIAICLAGLLYMASVKKESGTVYLNTSGVELAAED